MPSTAVDLYVEFHGSIFLLTGASRVGRRWMDEHLPEDAQRWGPHSVVVEPRYMAAIVEGALNDGLEVE